MTAFERPRVQLPYSSQPGVMREFDRSGLPTEASMRMRPVNAWPNAAGYANEYGRILSRPELEAIGQATIHAARSEASDASGNYPDLLGPPASAQLEGTELVEEEVRDLIQREEQL